MVAFQPRWQIWIVVTENIQPKIFTTALYRESLLTTNLGKTQAALFTHRACRAHHHLHYWEAPRAVAMNEWMNEWMNERMKLPIVARFLPPFLGTQEIIQSFCLKVRVESWFLLLFFIICKINFPTSLSLLTINSSPWQWCGIWLGGGLGAKEGPAIVLS